MHLSCDSTMIEAREKAGPKETPPQTKRKRGRPKKGEERDKQPTRLEKQASNEMGLSEMIADLPTACDVGTKRNSKGYNLNP